MQCGRSSTHVWLRCVCTTMTVAAAQPAAVFVGWMVGWLVESCGIKVLIAQMPTAWISL